MDLGVMSARHLCIVIWWRESEMRVAPWVMVSVDLAVSIRTFWRAVRSPRRVASPAATSFSLFFANSIALHFPEIPQLAT